MAKKIFSLGVFIALACASLLPSCQGPLDTSLIDEVATNKAGSIQSVSGDKTNDNTSSSNLAVGSWYSSEDGGREQWLFTFRSDGTGTITNTVDEGEPHGNIPGDYGIQTNIEPFTYTMNGSASGTIIERWYDEHDDELVTETFTFRIEGNTMYIYEAGDTDPEWILFKR